MVKKYIDDEEYKNSLAFHSLFKIFIMPTNDNERTIAWKPKRLLD